MITFENKIISIAGKKYICALLILLTGYAPTGYAQNPDFIFRHITENDGLINNKVTVLYQDKEGFLWIGTQAGLQRYDGTRFKNYLADIRDTAALQSDWISAIFEDSKKRLWIGNDLGAPYVLNRQTWKFHNYNRHATDTNQVNGIWHFEEDKQGAIWIAGHNGYYRLNDATNQFEKCNHKLGIEKDAITGSLTIDAGNNFWLCTSTGVLFYNQQEKKLYSRKYNPFRNPIFDINENIGKIIATEKNVWITCDRIIYRYNHLSGQLKSYTFNKQAVKPGERNIQKEKIGNSFFLQDGKLITLLPERGMALYQEATDDFLIVDADNTTPYTLHLVENIESNLFALQDQKKNILIGSDLGLNIFNPDKHFFQTHGFRAKKNNLFPNGQANDFLQLPDGDIFISYYNTKGGIVKMNSNFQFKKQYLLHEKGNELTGVNQIWNLFKDDDGNIWAPNQKKTILKLNLHTDQLTEEVNRELSGPINFIKKESNGDIWLGHWKKGLVKMEAGNHALHFYPDFLFSDSSDKKMARSFLEDGDKLWVGTSENGLQVFDKKSNRFTEAFVTSETNPFSISNNCVTDILRYSNDTLIVATLMGINIFDTKNKTFKAITARDGIPNNLVQTLMKDDQGYVWVACFNNGLCKINIHTLAVTNYDVNDGNTDNIFTSKFYQLKNGNVLIGASGSFISFTPSSITASALPSDVVLTGVFVFEKVIMADSLLKNNQPLQLSYKDNSVRIEFASLEFWNPGSIKYYFKLDGVDKDWITADKSYAAVYNQLKAGKYIFNVKCANRDGIFCNGITQLTIVITPPFWKTGWFITMASLLAIGLVFGTIKWREKNIKVIEAEKLKVEELNAGQYKSKLELEQITNYFSYSLIDKNTVEDVLWDVAKNLIGRLGFVDCMMYLWNADKTKMIQRASYGTKASIEEMNLQYFDVLPGQGIVGHVIKTKLALIVADTSTDSRYRADDMIRSSEIAVPVIYNNELIGVIDSEHPDKNFYTQRHLQILSTIATLMATKIKSIEAEQSLQQTRIEMYSMNELLSKAKLEALRSQMNPHFIFNSLNAIQECILTNKVVAAYEYLSKFSRLQRMVLNNSEKELIPLSSEIEMLELYLQLESLRFSKSFSYQIDVTGITDAEEIMIPSLLTQPLVENAIWHGLRNKDGEKTLIIKYEEKDGSIFTTIDDNGIGREKAAIIRRQKIGNKQFVSKGTMILQQRLLVLSQQLKAEIVLTTTDKKDAAGNATGTTVTISFPSNLGAD